MKIAQERQGTLLRKPRPKKGPRFQRKIQGILCSVFFSFFFKGNSSVNLIQLFQK